MTVVNDMKLKTYSGEPKWYNMFYTYIIVKNMKSYALYMPARIFQRYIGKRI